jgi:hypothetical protein
MIGTGGFRAWLYVWVAATSVVLSGCSQFILLGYLLGGPPSIEPDFDLMTKKSMTAKDDTVVVVCYAPTELKWDFDEVDQEITKHVSNRLFLHKIKVVDPNRVRDWLDKHEDWDKPEEIGAAFHTKYVVYIDLHKYSLYEEHSANLYRGRAEALVSVFEMDESGEGEKIYTKDLTSFYPLAAPRSTSEVSYGHFKKEYLSRLSEEIGRLFYEHYNGDDMPDTI